MPVMNQTPWQPETAVPQAPMQRVHRRQAPLTREELASARELEQRRMEWDTMYITQAEAASIPEEALTPELMSRITYSQRDWPENRMAMSQALGPLEPGEGEAYYEDRQMDANTVFWTPTPASQGPQLRGRRVADHANAINKPPAPQPPMHASVGDPLPVGSLLR
jgi:hypothetical protein